MSASLERLKQREEPQNEPLTMQIMEVLTSVLTAVNLQNTRLDTLAKTQQSLASYVKVMDEETATRIDRMEQRLQSSITREFALAPNDSSTSVSVKSELHEIGQTLNSLASAIDGRQLTSAVQSLESATTQIVETTAWNSEQAKEFVAKYRQALNAAGRAIISTKDGALSAIMESASASADTVTEQIDSALERVRTATERTEKAVEVAERLQKPLGWAAAARMALALLPVAIVLLMGVQSIWALAVGVQWAVAQEWPLWHNIIAGLGITALIAGASFGLWRLTVWVRSALEEASNRLGR